MTGAQVNKCLIWVIGTASLQPNTYFGYIRSQREADIVANCGMTSHKTAWNLLGKFSLRIGLWMSVLLRFTLSCNNCNPSHKWMPPIYPMLSAPARRFSQFRVSPHYFKLSCKVMYFIISLYIVNINSFCQVMY